MNGNDTNILFIISQFNTHYLAPTEEDVTPALLHKLNKKMVNSIFKFTKEVDNKHSTYDVYSLIKVRVLSLLSLHDFWDEKRRLEICDCLNALEQLHNEDDDEELTALLLCLYKLSKINNSKERCSIKDSDSILEQKCLYLNSSESNDANGNSFKTWQDRECSSLLPNLEKLYLKSSGFNEINWDLFRLPQKRNSKRDTEHTLMPSNLYFNSSHFNDLNWEVFQFSQNQDSQNSHSSDLYLNLQCFNDINWKAFKEQSRKKKDSNTSQEIPEYYHQQNVESFSDIFKYKVWNFDINRPVESVVPDEGFVTPGSNFSEEPNECDQSSDSEMLTLSTAASIRSSQTFEPAHYIWEQVGNPYPAQELPFASELHNCVILLWKIWNVTREPKIKATLGMESNFDDLKADINHLLFGVASNSFYFAPVTKTFHLRKNFHMRIITPEALASFCQPFMECANHFVALKDYAESRAKTECGPLYQTFCKCIQGLLQIHRYCLLNTNWQNIHRLLQLEAISLPLRKKLSFVYTLCTNIVSEGCDKFPRGVQLLNHLFDNLVKIETSDFKFLLLYFFEECCNVYLKIVSEWMFNGCFSNPANYDEFFIQIQHELEVCWDWRRVDYIRLREKHVPKVLEKFYKNIFTCGKSVNLLGIFSRKEIFENILPRTYPSIRCCFNSAQIEEYALEWKHFQANFYKKHNWCVTLKDRFTKTYSAEFYNQIRETRRKWFKEYENRQREKIGSSVSTYGASGDGGKAECVTSEIVLAVPKPEQTDIEVASQSIPPALKPIHIVSESGDAPSSIASETLLTNCHIARTDLNDPKLRTRLTVTLPSPILKKAGDAPSQDVSLERTAYQCNRQKSAFSEYQEQLNMTLENTFLVPKVASTPMTECAQNRLKNMSTTFNDTPVMTRPSECTPVTDCMRNKLKVMRSEYYERLSCSDLQPTKQLAKRELHELNECERNKLKVMSSEFHLRLNALAEQESIIDNKLSKIIHEREVNKEKVLAEEYHQPLKVTHTLKFDDTNEGIAEQVTNDGNCSKITSQESATNEETETTVVKNFENNLEQNVMSIVEKPVRENPFDLEQYCKHSNIFNKSINQLSSATHSVKDVDITSVLYYLSPSISIPLKIQSKLVNEAILWVFIEQEKYIEHLTVLRNYVFLRKPGFCLSLTNSLFEMCEEVKKPSLLLSSYSLDGILQRALSASNSKSSMRFERNLMFVLEDPIPDTFDLTDVQMLRCLSMCYVVKWPVNVLITEQIMKKYSRVFRFLIQLERVSWVLKSDFREMKNLKLGKSIQYTQVQLYRHHMTQVTRLLKEYIMREALEQCWNDLVNRLVNIKIDLDELYISHLKYINKIIQRCFLCEESILCHKVALHIFSSVLRYHDALRKGLWRRNEEFNLLYHTNYKNLHTVYQEFRKNLDNFRVTLKVLVYQKQKMYFEPLLLELSNNTKIEAEL